MTRDKKIFNIAMNKLKNLTDDEWAVMKKKYTEDKTNYNVPDGVELLYPRINSTTEFVVEVVVDNSEKNEKLNNIPNVDDSLNEEIVA